MDGKCTKIDMNTCLNAHSYIYLYMYSYIECNMLDLSHHNQLELRLGVRDRLKLKVFAQHTPQWTFTDPDRL